MQFRVHRHGLLDSTSEHAFRELAADRARHGDAHVAAGQTRGRGRLGRSWESAPEEGLYLSVVLVPEPDRVPPPAALTMTSGLAVRAALAGLGVDTVTLRWPNDVLVRGAKVAGILVESRGTGEAPRHFVIGIGVNVLQRSFPAELEDERAVTSVALSGCRAGVEDVLARLLHELGGRLDADLRPGGPFEREFLLATGLRGARVRVRRGRGEVEGYLEDITLREGLCLRRADGWLAKVPVEHVTGVETAVPGEPPRDPRPSL